MFYIIDYVKKQWLHVFKHAKTYFVLSNLSKC